VDGAYFTDQVAWSFCRSAAEPIEMLFGFWTRVGTRKDVLDRGPGLPCERAILRRKGAARCKVWGLSAVICAITAEPIEMPFRVWTRVGQGSMS